MKNKIAIKENFRVRNNVRPSFDNLVKFVESEKENWGTAETKFNKLDYGFKEFIDAKIIYKEPIAIMDDDHGTAYLGIAPLYIDNDKLPVSPNNPEARLIICLFIGISGLENSVKKSYPFTQEGYRDALNRFFSILEYTYDGTELAEVSKQSFRSSDIFKYLLTKKF